MAKAAKKKAVKKRADKYEKTPIKGTFLEIMQAAAKNANDNSAKKKDRNLTTILGDKGLKAKQKTAQIGQLLLDRTLTADEVVSDAKATNDVNKATLLESLEYASKKEPQIVSENAFKYAIQSLQEQAPRVKWESAKVITNTAQLFPKLLSKAVGNLLTNTEHEGNVVRWSAAHAISKIMLCKTPLNKELIPAVEAIIKRESDNAIIKIYQQGLKKVAN